MAINQQNTDKKVFFAPKATSAAIAQYRFGNQIISESEAIRRLIEKGLEAWKAEGRTEGGAQG